jgi:thiosulfate dehydrogenase [quinone] large subunit
MNKIRPVHILRFGLGINMLTHGLVRLPKLNGFATKMAAMFTDTWLPQALVKPFLYVLPFLELTAGILILIGGKASRAGYLLGGAIMAALLFGTTLREDWNTAGSQMIYVIAFAIALHFYDRDEISHKS